MLHSRLRSQLVRGIVRQQRQCLFIRLIALCGLSLVVDGTQRVSSVVAQVGRDTIQMQVAWEIAPGLHATANSIGELSGVAVDESGNIYASDILAVTVWVFDRHGRSLESFGREGDGPGEFRFPTGIAIGPDGRLYVRDYSRVSRFGPNPETNLLTDFEGSFSGPVNTVYRSKRTTRFLSTGFLLYPSSDLLIDIFSPGGEAQGTINVPEYPNAPPPTIFVRLGATDGMMLRGLNHVPFAALPVWDVTGSGTVISGDAKSYGLQETTRDGRVVREFRRAESLHRIPAGERDDSLYALRERLNNVPVPLSQVQGLPEEVRRLDVPEHYPTYMAVYVGIDSTVWVRKWSPAAANRSVFDVFTQSGEFIETVILPRIVMVEPTPVLSASDIVAVRLDPETGENIIVRFQRRRRS